MTSATSRCRYAISRGCQFFRHNVLQVQCQKTHFQTCCDIRDYWVVWRLGVRFPVLIVSRQSSYAMNSELLIKQTVSLRLQQDANSVLTARTHNDCYASEFHFLEAPRYRSYARSTYCSAHPISMIWHQLTV